MAATAECQQCLSLSDQISSGYSAARLSSHIPPLHLTKCDLSRCSEMLGYEYDKMYDYRPEDIVLVQWYRSYRSFFREVVAMPVYEYQCTSCSERFESRRSTEDSDSDIRCPKCHAEYPRRVFSRFVSRPSGASGGSCSPAPTRFS